VIPLLLACAPSDEPASSETADTGEAPDAATVPLAGACAMDVDYGGFLVATDASSTDLGGAVADGVVPISVLEETAAEGDCVVLRQNNPYCEPTCDPGEACDFDGTCLPYPANQDLGVVRLQGLYDALKLEPVFPGNTYYATDLPFPAMDAGAVLTLRTGDGAYDPVVLHGVAGEALEVADPAWTVDEGVDLDVRWTPPTSGVVRTEVGLALALDQHGATPSVLRCAFEDAGAGTVPGALLSALFAGGITGFPNGTLTRRTTDGAAVAEGCMDFEVSTTLTAEVDVVGHTPCVTTEDCPDDQTCDEEYQTCV
jgi:hypothetical protein